MIERFGYLQLDTVSVAGARSHVLVLLSRLQGHDPAVGETLLRPGEPLFEYWGHEASWMPLELYPAFDFRRRALRRRGWVRDVLNRYPQLATELQSRLRDEGPLRSTDLEGKGGGGWWDFKMAKHVANALWSVGDIAIRERRSFQRIYDLPERVIPETLRQRPLEREESFRLLLLKALDGHGWATTGTLARTWRLRNIRGAVESALDSLESEGRVSRCELRLAERVVNGWIRPQDLELVDRLADLRPRRDRGVLLSPFDPVLWDRERVLQLFGFHQVLEIFKPARERVYGYFCLPVLAGDRLVGRYDLKAHRRQGRLEVRRRHLEPGLDERGRQAMRAALARHSATLELAIADD